MTKTTLFLSLALTVSVLVNVALWRREPAPAPILRITTTPPAAASPEVPSDPAVARLREEVRTLKDQLAAAKASIDIGKPGQAPVARPEPQEPEALDYEALFAHLQAFIETRKAQGVDQDGKTVTFEKQVLTPENRGAALHVLAEYFASDDATRGWFCARAETVIQQYWRTREEEERDSASVGTTLEQLNRQERFEDIAALNEKFAQRSKERQGRWERDHLEPLRKDLGGRSGIRPALLSRHLGDLLWQLITPDER